MTDQIKLLEELQKIDARIEEHRQAAAAVPERLSSMRENLQRVENLLAEERARLAEAEKYHSEQERELRLEAEQIQKAKSKQQQVRNTKEYMAVTRELETLRKMSGDREEEVMKMIDAVEKSRASLGQHDVELTAMRQQVAGEEATARQSLAEMELAVAESRKARDAGRPPPSRRAQGLQADCMKRGWRRAGAQRDPPEFSRPFARNC